jgi:putative endonuclease
MMFSVYAIKSQIDSRIYVGFTSNVTRRLQEHNSGKTKSTKGFKPWKLIYSEECETRVEARKREKYLKSGIGKEFLKNIKMDL